MRDSPERDELDPPHRGGAVSAPPPSGGPKWQVNFPKGSDHPVTP